MEFQLTKKQRNIVSGAAKEKHKPLLHCVHVRKGILEVADGFIMVQKLIDYDGDEDVWIDIDHIKEHKADGSKPIEYSINNGKVRAEGKITYESDCVPPEPIIDFETIYPKGEPEYMIALSSNVLRSVLDSLDSPKAILRLYFYGKEAAVKFEANDDTKGCMLPCFVQW